MRHWSLRHLRYAIDSDLRERGNRWAKCCSCLRSLPWEHSQARAQGGGTEKQPSRIAGSRRWGWELGKNKATRVLRIEFQRGESYTERQCQRSALGSPWVFSWVLSYTYGWGNWGQGKNHPNEWKLTVPGAYTRPGPGVCFHQLEWNLLYHRQWVEFGLSSGE